MKKIVLSIVILGLISIQGFSQNKMIVPVSVYEDMKIHKALKADVEYIQVPDAHPTRPMSSISNDPIAHHVPSQKNLVYHPNQPSTAGPNCSCIATIDTSFHVAEFTNGTPPDYRNDDGSTNAKAIPFTFCLYGTNYTSLYINNNGNVSFTAAYGTYTPVGFPSNQYVMVAPFWGDVETTGAGSGLVYYKIMPHYMIVQWDSVGYFNNHADKRNSFQVIITDGSDPILPSGNNIAFCYGSMEWTTGDASSGINGFDGNPAEPATVGVNKGDGITDYQLGEFGIPGVSYTGAYLPNINGVSWLNYQSLYFNSCNSTNIAPIASGLNNCDTIKICGTGDSLYLNALFLSPEASQNTVITINLNGTPGASIISNNSGNVADAIVMIVASNLNAGANTITFTATDNGVPIGITTVNAIVYVDTTGLSNFNPHITGNLTFCFGDSTLLSVTPTTYSSYVWNTGATSTSIYADDPGQYYVTSGLNGCFKTSVVNVIEHHPTPLIAGYPFTCMGNSTSLYSDSLIYVNYQWSSGSTNDSIMAPNGTYTLTVTDSFGCTATSAPVTVTGPVPPVITGITAVCNGTLAELWTTLSYTSYIWSEPGNPNLSTQDTIHVPAPGPYTVNVVDVNGCTLTSLPFTIAPFNYALSVTGVAPYCAGHSITLSASTTNSGASPTYLWSTSAVTPTISVNAAGTFTVTLTYANGCTADTVVTVAPPNPLPTPVIQGALFTCDTTHTTLSVNNSYSSYLWSPNSNTTSTISVLTGVFSVTVTDANGCIGTSPSDTVVNANPTVSISPPTITFCPGSNGVLTANPLFTSGANYLWSNAANSQSITVTSAGVYHVVVSYSNGCSTSDSAVVSLYNAPIANFNETPPNTSGPNVPVNFHDLSSVASGTITNWVWNFGDSSLVFHSGQNPTHTYPVDGTYHVTEAVESSNGCWDTIHFDYLVVSDIQEPNVFTPNVPGTEGVNQYLYFKNLEYFPGAALTVYNRWGNKVYESSNYDNHWNGGKETDGVYYYVLSGGGLKTSKYGFVQLLR